MPETLIADLGDYRKLMASVRNDSTIRVNKMVSSVPCRLTGLKLLVQIGGQAIPQTLNRSIEWSDVFKLRIHHHNRKNTIAAGPLLVQPT